MTPAVREVVRIRGFASPGDGPQSGMDFESCFQSLRIRESINGYLGECISCTHLSPHLIPHTADAGNKNKSDAYFGSSVQKCAVKPVASIA
jgi:hypothetical protein